MHWLRFVKRFPESPYARDSRLKVELCIDHLAGKEMAVGRYYQKNQQYIGAINRYRVVIERYQTTTHVPEALHRAGGDLPLARREGRGQGSRGRPRL